MKIAVWKNHLVGQILYGSLVPSKKTASVRDFLFVSQSGEFYGADYKYDVYVTIRTRRLGLAI